MNNRRIGILAALLTIISILAQHVLPITVASRYQNGVLDMPGWLPTVATVGQTVILYELLADVIGIGVTVALGIGFGYVLGYRRSIIEDLHPILRSLVLGSFTGILLSAITVFVLGPSLDVDFFGIGYALLAVLRLTLGVTVVLIATTIVAALLRSTPTTGTQTDRTASDSPDSTRIETSD